MKTARSVASRFVAYRLPASCRVEGAEKLTLNGPRVRGFSHEILAYV